MTTWVCRAGRGGQWAQDFERGKFISIGWGMGADLTKLSRAELLKRISEEEPGHVSRAAVPTGMLWRFMHEMREGEAVITPDGATRELLVGVIAGSCEFRADAAVGDHHHYHSVRWEGRYPRDRLSQRLKYSLGSVMTLFTFDGAEHALLELRSLHTSPAKAETEEAEDATAVEEIIEDTEGKGRQAIEDRLAALDDNALEAFVAGLLRAMGYYTRVAGGGADGGVDVRAARDPLFSQGPYLKVQIKARPTTPMDPSPLRALVGVLRPGERGIFVSSGGFTPAARAESSDTLTLIDLPQLQQLYVQYYEQVDEQTRALLPLKKLWFPAGL